MDIRTISTAGYDLYNEPCPEVIGTGSGSIELESGWQLAAIPVKYGYWSNTLHKHIHDDITLATIKNYVIDQIEDLYGADKIEVSNTYLGDNQFFYSYVPGVTPDTSPHNFQLVYSDGSNEEISGFWIKTASSVSMYITWGEI